MPVANLSQVLLESARNVPLDLLSKTGHVLNPKSQAVWSNPLLAAVSTVAPNMLSSVANAFKRSPVALATHQLVIARNVSRHGAWKAGCASPSSWSMKDAMLHLFYNPMDSAVFQTVKFITISDVLNANRDSDFFLLESAQQELSMDVTFTTWMEDA